MLTYRIQSRIFRSTENLIFPNEVEVRLKLRPLSPHDQADDAPELPLDAKRTGIFYFDANTGRGWVRWEPPFPQLHVTSTFGNGTFVLCRDEVTWSSHAANLDELSAMVQTFYYLWPLILNLDFAEPPVVERVEGRVGTSTFQWEHTEVLSFTEGGVPPQERESAVKLSVETMAVLGHPDNRRLTAALDYFYIACRLLSAGHSPWEFMAEVILNLTKTLEILFGRTRDDIRSGLSKLGCTPEQIEGDFIPMMILRNEFDVGHPLGTPRHHDELELMYRYLIQSLGPFKRLLRLAIARTKDGTLQLAACSEPHSDLKFDQLIESFRSRMEGHVRKQ